MVSYFIGRTLIALQGAALATLALVLLAWPWVGLGPLQFKRSGAMLMLSAEGLDPTLQPWVLGFAGLFAILLLFPLLAISRTALALSAGLAGGLLVHLAVQESRVIDLRDVAGWDLILRGGILLCAGGLLSYLSTAPLTFGEGRDERSAGLMLLFYGIPGALLLGWGYGARATMWLAPPEFPRIPFWFLALTLVLILGGLATLYSHDQERAELFS